MLIILREKQRPFLPYTVTRSANITNNMYKLFKCEQKAFFLSPS